MKRKVIGIVAAAFLSAGGAMYAFNNQDGSLHETSDNLLVQECPLAGTSECPLVKAEAKVPDCCKKK